MVQKLDRHNSALRHTSRTCSTGHTRRVGQIHERTNRPILRKNWTRELDEAQRNLQCQSFSFFDPFMDTISKGERRIILSLRTNKPLLGETRHAAGRAESNKCPLCGEGPETREHFLLRCSSDYARQRRSEFTNKLTQLHHDNDQTTLNWIRRWRNPVTTINNRLTMLLGLGLDAVQPPKEAAHASFTSLPLSTRSKSRREL